MPKLLNGKVKQVITRVKRLQVKIDFVYLANQETTEVLRC